MASSPIAGSPRVSCDNACHKARGSAGGTDYAVSVGTAGRAPFAGRAYRGYNSAAGNYLFIANPAGPIAYLMHLSSYVEGDVRGELVAERQLVARSGGAKGAPGSGSSTGPHLHAHVVDDGVLYGMEEWLAMSNPAGDLGTPLDPDAPPVKKIKRIGKDMLILGRLANEKVAAIAEGGGTRWYTAAEYALHAKIAEFYNGIMPEAYRILQPPPLSTSTVLFVDDVAFALMEAIYTSQPNTIGVALEGVTSAQFEAAVAGINANI